MREIGKYRSQVCELGLGFVVVEVISVQRPLHCQKCLPYLLVMYLVYELRAYEERDQRATPNINRGVQTARAVWEANILGPIDNINRLACQCAIRECVVSGRQFVGQGSSPGEMGCCADGVSHSE